MYAFLALYLGTIEEITIPLSSVLTIATLAATIALIVTRPWGLSEGIGAAIGALAVLILGTATPGDVWRGTSETAGVLVFLIAMMVVATIAEEAGCFEWAAHQAVVLSKGHGRW